MVLAIALPMHRNKHSRSFQICSVVRQSKLYVSGARFARVNMHYIIGQENPARALRSLAISCLSITFVLRCLLTLVLAKLRATEPAFAF
jgi:hypothetical protein